MTTLIKGGKSKARVTEHDAMLPKTVKKVMQQHQRQLVNQTTMSGGLLRLLDANSDCI